MTTKHNYKGVSINKRSDGLFAFAIESTSIRHIKVIGTLTKLKLKIDAEMERGATTNCGVLVRAKVGA